MSVLYCFANISATKAPIFIKFKTQGPKVVMDYQNNFRETNACSRGVNMGTREKKCTRTFRPSVPAFVHGSLQKEIVSIKFHKDQSFHCRDICKIIMPFLK